MHHDAQQQLHTAVQQLGQAHHQISPAVYDSAVRLRCAAPGDPLAPPIADWLVRQQHPDGGWGDPEIALVRTIATLAAAVALADHDPSAAARGLELLRGAGAAWRPDALADDIPVAAELIIPALVDTAAARGLAVPAAPAALRQLGQRRRARLRRQAARPTMAALHSWEAWGQTPAPAHLDAIGSVGHSPAATAAWIAAARPLPELGPAVERARAYLEQASRATAADTPGLLPNVWPIETYEIIFALYMLAVGGWLHDPLFEPAVAAHVSGLRQQLARGGIGLSPYFTPDGDDTAVAAVIVRLWDQTPVSLRALEPFRHGDHFCTYHGELQPSLSATVHAMHALQVNDAACDPALYRFVLERQSRDGRWFGDKWHASWTYTSCQVVMVLDPFAHAIPLRRFLTGVCHAQQPGGGWGMAGASREETAYVVIALRLLRARAPHLWTDDIAAALWCAEQWMQSSFRAGSQSAPRWLGKELYQPCRLATVVELIATLPDRCARTEWSPQRMSA